MRLQKRFGRLLVLNVLANVTVPLSSLADTAMLGFLPDVRFLAGVALASVLFDYLFWTFGFLRMSTTGLTAIAVGQGRSTESYLVLYRAWVVAVTVGVLLLLFSAPLGDLGFALLRGDTGVEAAGAEYYRARIWGAPAALSNFVLLGWFLGREQSGRALAMTVVANGANIALNYLFIVRLDWQSFGAGLGTAISQYAMLAIGLLLFFRERKAMPLHEIFPLVFRQVFHWGAFVNLFALNRDILIRTFCLVSAFALFTDISATMGTVVLASNALLLRIQSFAAYIIDGAAYATETLAGVLYGKGDQAGLRKVLLLALAFGAAIAVAVGAPMLLVPGDILSLLTSDVATIHAGERVSAFLLPVLLLGSGAFALDGFFLGLTKGRTIRNAMLLSVLVGFLPLAYWASSSRSPDLLWWAMVTFMGARCLTLGWPAYWLARGRSL